MNPTGRQPLTGIRILDLTRLLPGPWATMLLADLGAEVLKVENPETEGDPARHAQPRYAANGHSQSVYFCSTNRNKRSVVLDLKGAAGRQSLLDLVRQADVVVESFRQGVAERLGIEGTSCTARCSSPLIPAIFRSCPASCASGPVWP